MDVRIRIFRNWELNSKFGKLGFQETKLGNQDFEGLFKVGILSKWISKGNNNNDELIMIG